MLDVLGFEKKLPTPVNSKVPLLKFSLEAGPAKTVSEREIGRAAASFMQLNLKNCQDVLADTFRCCFFFVVFCSRDVTEHTNIKRNMTTAHLNKQK